MSPKKPERAVIRERAEADPGASPSFTLTLTFDERRKSRFLARLEGGGEAEVFLARGSVLRGGDLLRTEDGRLVAIRSASELVSTASAADPRLIARAAYHLGNRHVPVQIEVGWLRYEHDHVLDDLVHGLGLALRIEQAEFEPEGGSYAGHGHERERHHHEHSHGE